MRREFDWKLPEKITARLGKSSYGRQRTIFEEGHLLIILHQPPDTFGQPRNSVVLYRNIKGEWYCNGQDNGLRGLKRLTADYHQRAEELEKMFRVAETPELLLEVIEKTTPLSHAAVNLYQTLQTAREQVKDDIEIIEERDKAYEIQRAFELLLANARAALDFRVAKNAEEDARVSRDAVRAQHRLNVLAAIFFPLTALTAIFDMNFPSGLEVLGIAGFWGVFGGGIFLGVLLRSWVLSGHEGKNSL